MGRIVDEDVEPAELGHRAFDQGLAVGLLADVAGDEHSVSTRLVNPAGSLASVIFLTEVGDQDVGPLTGEGNGDCPPDPRSFRR